MHPFDAAANNRCNDVPTMDAPLVNQTPRMFCRTCGYILVGLPSNRCPECGGDFDPANPKTFLTHPRRIILRRFIKIGVVLLCLIAPLAAYVAYLDWQVHVENKAIAFLQTQPGVQVFYYDTTPHWAKVILRGHAAWLWQRAQIVTIFVRSDDPARPQVMAAVENLNSLEEIITLCYFPIDSDLEHFKNLTALKRLRLYGGEVTDVGMAQLKGLTALQMLQVDGPHITDAGLAQIGGLTRIKELSLWSTQITDAGLAQLKGFVKLETLDLSDTKVTDAGLAHLAGLVKLKTLNLASTKVTDDGLVHLYGLTSLRYLRLERTQVTNAGVSKLQTALPQCEITHDNR